MPDGEDTPRTTWQIQDFSGGINQDISPVDMAPTECLEAHNVKFFRPAGCVSPRPGRRWMVGTTGTPMVQSLSTDAIGIYQYKTSAGVINPMLATYYATGAASTLSASIGYLDANGQFDGIISTSHSPLHYAWTGAGRVSCEVLSAFTHYPNSADYVCMTTYEDHLIATWAPSADYENAMPPVMWDGITASATVLHVSSGPQLGPEDDGSGILLYFDGGTAGSALAVGNIISSMSGGEDCSGWGVNVVEGSYTGTAPNQTGYIRYDMLSGGPPEDDDAIVVAPYVCGGFSADVNGDPWPTSSERLISVMIDLSAAYCGTFKGYCFFMDTVEYEIISSDGSGAGLFSAMWHPYRARWNNPAASSIKCAVESGGGVAWDYEDYADFDPRDGYGITGYGILGDKMLVFKKNKTYEVSWVGGDEIFQYKKLSDEIGCVSHRSIVTTTGGAAWLADDGFYYFDGTTPKKVSDKIKDVCAKLNRDREFLACGSLWPELRQSYWSIPVDTSQENNQGLLWDFSGGEQGAWSTTGISMGNLIPLSKVVVEQSAVGIWGTDYSGWAYMYDEDITTETSGTQTDGTAVGVKASAGVDYSWKSGWLIFDDLEHVKRIKRVRSVLDRSTTAGHLSVAVRKNWEDDGIPDAISLRPLSGRAGLSGDQIYDKCDYTAMGQALQLGYATSAGPSVEGTPGEAGSAELQVDTALRDGYEYSDTGVARAGQAGITLLPTGAHSDIVDVCSIHMWESTIPKKAQVLCAHFTPYIHNVVGSYPGLSVYGEKVVNASAITDLEINNITARPETTAVCAWTPSGAGAWFNVDVTGIVQEIVDQTNYHSGNWIALIVANSGTVPSVADYIQTRSQAYAGDYGAKLSATYVCDSLSSHHWTLHDISLDYDTLGTVFVGDY